MKVALRHNHTSNRGLQFRLNVTRIRGFSPGTFLLEEIYGKMLLRFRISALSTSCSLREPSLAELFREKNRRTHRIRDVQTELQSAVLPQVAILHRGIDGRWTRRQARRARQKVCATF